MIQSRRVLRTLYGRLGRATLMGSAFVLTGCATAVRGTHQDFGVVSTPPGAEAFFSSGESCVTPCSIRLRRSDPFQVRVSKSGYVPQTVSVTSKVGGGGAMLLGNAILGGIAGAAIDSGSGAMNNLRPNPVDVTLTPISAGPVSDGPKASDPTPPPATDDSKGH